jgi:hypothetical protein
MTLGFGPRFSAPSSMRTASAWKAGEKVGQRKLNDIVG